MANVAVKGTQTKEKKAAKAPKAPKEKKTKAPKPSAPSHPPYFQMIKEAISVLHERTGSSPYAIAKYMEEKHKKELPANFRKMLALQLKNSVAKGKVVKVKGSFKLAVTGKDEKKQKPKPKPKPKPKLAKKPAKKPAKMSAAGSVKALMTKKAKRGATAKARQPKSIKSPVVKRARRAAAA